MTPALALIAVGLVMVAGFMLGGCLDGLSDSRCEPSGTFVESSGLRVRVHSAQLCDGRGPGS